MGAIRWSVTAQQDLENIGDFIALDSPVYAINFIERVLEAIEHLISFPELGRIVPEFNNQKIRELIFHDYRIVYKVIETSVVIVSITHGSMDLIRKSKRENWEIR
ncbi:MAG: type II toxin-antitoxin system RelE/ParE family toxin [bacterium]|nr:type II toxin-antitoxin system RelE/ParE family toxin [bacterium]